MSPGLFALGPGKFSHRGVTTTRLILKKMLYISESEVACGRTEDGASQWQEPPTQPPQRHLQITLKLRASPPRMANTHPYRHASTSCPMQMVSRYKSNTGKDQGTDCWRLQTDPAGVEGNAFANEGNGLILPCGPIVVAEYSIETSNKINSRLLSHISRSLAGSDVPLVTDKKVLYKGNLNNDRVLSPGVYAPFPFRRPILKVTVVSARDHEIHKKERKRHILYRRRGPTFITDNDLSIRNICELGLHSLRKSLRERSQLDLPMWPCTCMRTVGVSIFAGSSASYDEGGNAQWAFLAVTKRR
jgi:hypothetical protein